MQPKLLPSNVILSRNIFFVLFLNIVPQFFVKRRVAEDKNGNMINLKKPGRIDTIYIYSFFQFLYILGLSYELIASSRMLIAKYKINQQI